jgi:quinone-modifying oxidoreductase, subunit QmoC
MSEQAATTSGRERLRPDRELLAALLGSGGEDLRQCMQCATCSAVCELADANNPGPRKEMLWAQWGLRDRLMGDPDIWLCHQCGDCTLRCPRGARPGDVMAALRRECIVHYSTPRAFGRWLGQPHSLFWLALLAVVVFGAAAGLWQRSGVAAVELALDGPRLVFPFWSFLPHWLLGTVFGLVVVFDVLVLVRGARRFWRDMQKRAGGEAGEKLPGLGKSLRGAFRRILWHDDFGLCVANRARRTHHLLVIYGMLALWLVSLWAVTARWNPLLSGLVYPFGFWNPWKVMANLAGLAVGLGATLMLYERWQRPQTAGATRYADSALLGFLLLIVLSGFASELLHFARLEPHRYLAYGIHLVSVFALLLLLPYSKLAHVVYRTLALVHAERSGRGRR